MIPFQVVCVCVAYPYTLKYKPLNSGSQILVCIRITRRACQKQLLDPTPRISATVSLGRDLGMCIPTKFPGDADAPGPRTPLGKPLPYRVVCYRGRVESSYLLWPHLQHEVPPEPSYRVKWCQAHPRFSHAWIPLLSCLLSYNYPGEFKICKHVPCSASASRLKKKKVKDMFCHPQQTKQ